MYTAKLITRDMDQGRYKWTVEFTDGSKTWTEFFYDGKYEQVRNRVAYKLKELNEVDTFTEGQTIDPIVNTPVIQTPEEIARDKWLQIYTKWVRIKTTLIDTGILTGNETKLTQLKAKVQSDFIPAYIDNI